MITLNEGEWERLMAALSGEDDWEPNETLLKASRLFRESMISEGCVLRS